MHVHTLPIELLELNARRADRVLLGPIQSRSEDKKENTEKKEDEERDGEEEKDKKKEWQRKTMKKTKLKGKERRRKRSSSFNLFSFSSSSSSTSTTSPDSFFLLFFRLQKVLCFITTIIGSQHKVQLN